jgi:plasmid stabilization system protein ParE
MAVELILSPEAEQDILEAYGWYEHQRAGLGEE